MIEKRYSKTILHVIDSLALGGAEKLLVNTVHALDEYSHVICLLNGVNRFENIGKGNVVIINLEHKDNLHFPLTVWKLRKIIKRYNPTLVHAHLLKSTWVARLATGRRYPFFFSVHNILSEDAFKMNRLSLFFEKLTYKPYHVIIGVSEEVLKDYDQWVGIKGKAYVLYNLIDAAFFKSQCYPRNDIKIKLVAVGNLRRQKNYMNLLKAFDFLKAKHVELDIYGDGGEKELLQKHIINNNLPVSLKGRTKDIDTLLPLYDAYILPSLFEGYGIAPVEAMAAGLPVLLSHIPVFKEITHEKAIFFNPSSPKDIAEKIIHFINMSVLERKSYSEELKKQAIRIGSPISFKNKIIEIYNSVL